MSIKMCEVRDLQEIFGVDWKGPLFVSADVRVTRAAFDLSDLRDDQSIQQDERRKIGWMTDRIIIEVEVTLFVLSLRHTDKISQLRT